MANPTVARLLDLLPAEMGARARWTVPDLDEERSTASGITIKDGEVWIRVDRTVFLPCVAERRRQRLARRGLTGGA